jgi:hypothetical protein
MIYVPRMVTLTDAQRALILALLRETRSPTETRKRLPEEARPSLRWLSYEAKRCKIKLVKRGRKRGQTGGGRRWSPVRDKVRELLVAGLEPRLIAIAVERTAGLVRGYKAELATENEKRCSVAKKIIDTTAQGV